MECCEKIKVVRAIVYDNSKDGKGIEGLGVFLFEDIDCATAFFLESPLTRDVFLTGE